MKSVKRMLFLGLTTISLLSAQNTSPLFQVMTTNSLINRPEVFREMQGKLDSEFVEKTPGLQIEELNDIFGTIRQQIMDVFADPQVTPSIDYKKITVEFSKRSFEFDVPADDTLGKVWRLLSDNLMEQAEKKLSTYLSSLNKSKTTDALIRAMTDALSHSKLLAGVDIRAFDDYEGTRKLAAILVAVIMNDIQQKVERQLALYNKHWQNDLPQFCDWVKARLVIISTQVRNELVDVVNSAETQLSDVIRDASMDLIAANSGAGITTGKGSFSGGLYVNVWHNTNWQFAGYVNGQLNQGDSTKPTESLIGLHARFGTDRFQYDLTPAVLFGDKQFKAWQAGELGFGVSVNTAGVVVGAAVYVLGAKSMHPFITIGASLKPVSVGGTGFFLGLQGQAGRWQPIIQTSFPILAKAG